MQVFLLFRLQNKLHQLIVLLEAVIFYQNK